MAKKTNQEETIVNVDELYSKSEQFVDKNRKQLTLGSRWVQHSFSLSLATASLVVAPKNTAAEEAAFMAEHYFAKDSADLAMLGRWFERRPRRNPQRPQRHPSCCPCGL